MTNPPNHTYPVVSEFQAGRRPALIFKPTRQGEAILGASVHPDDDSIAPQVLLSPSQVAFLVQELCRALGVSPPAGLDRHSDSTRDLEVQVQIDPRDDLLRRAFGVLSLPGPIDGRSMALEIAAFLLGDQRGREGR
jgi:hypothetical protein